jgi:type II secretory pathway component PulF
MNSRDELPSEEDLPIEAVQRLVQAGMPLARGLRAYAEEYPSQSAAALRHLAEAVESGTPLSSAIRQPGISIPTYLGGLIEGGLQSNTIGVMLEQYLHQRRRQRRLGQRAVLDFAYPLVVLLLTCVIGLSLLTWLVPMFKQMFEDFDLELPYMTRFVFMLASMVALLKWPIMLGLAAFSLVLVLLFVGSRWTIAIFDRIPFLGRSARYATMAEFCSLLAPLVQAGVPITRSLQAVASAMQPSLVRSGTVHLSKAYDGSETLAELADERSLLPPELVHLLRWEDRGQAFAEILKSWSELFGRLASGHSAKVSAMLAPLLMLGIGVFVGFLVIALFMPLVGLLNMLS